MQCRQYNVKVFEIGLEDPDLFLVFLKANEGLLKNHLLLIQGEEEERVLEYMNQRGLHYLFNTKLPPAKRGVERFEMLISEEEASLPEEAKAALESLKSDRSSSPQEQKRDSEEKEAPSPIKEEERFPAPLKVVSSALRSGQIVEYDGSVLLTERINSGAKVAALGSVVALGIVEGDLSSVGECIVVPPMKKGTLLFHGIKVEAEMLKYPLNKIHFIGEKLTIQPIKQRSSF